eukprot:m.97567 g.97567  ORF g.97567 m.97567 type:complete len:453 (+) comp8670_c0_seq2:339-1697(+)
MRSCVLSLMLAAQLVSASLHLLSYGMLPAHHRPLLVLWLILGAGVRDANGEWSLSKEIYNNAPQFQRRRADGGELHMFLTVEKDSAWWNIQELNISANGDQVYGRVLFGREASSSTDRVVPPASGWVDMDHAYARKQEAIQPPTVSVYGLTTGWEDCSDDACIEYYFYSTYPMFTRPDCDEVDGNNMCICPELRFTRDLSDDEIAQLRADWLREGIVSIKNYLLPDVMESWAKKLKRPQHSHLWYASYWDEINNSAKVVQRSPENEPSIKVALDHQHEMRNNNQYAYSFTRTLDHNSFLISRLYSIYLEHTQAFLQSIQHRGNLKAITNNSYELTTMFYARYRSGDFLDPHSDSVDERRIAFTLHFTEGWHLTFGGLLLVLQEYDWTQVRRVLVPSYGTFTFFDVSRERFQIPHTVSEVPRGVTATRIALTGWFQYLGGNSPHQLHVTDERP